MDQAPTPGRPNLDVFADTLQALAAEDRQLTIVTSDSRGSGRLVKFGERFPEQMVEVGIAEQNLVGIAAGLASCGKKVFAVSPASFLATRSLEQIKNDIAYSDNPVVLVGISAGVSYGALGSTHHSLHDFAALRAIHNLIIVAPADNVETKLSIESALQTDHPVYIRFGKKPMLCIHDESLQFSFGRAIEIRKGNDLAIIATGECVAPALSSAGKLESEHGIQARVISMHTLKPLDTHILKKAAEECGCILTVEEHSLYGGLGEACAATLLENALVPRFSRMGIPDEYTVTGSQSEIFQHYRLTADGISNEAIKLLNK